jgi:hypothetical protein
MWQKLRRGLFIVCMGILALLAPVVSAQDVPVPDLTGLSVAAATSMLNKIGLKVGIETNEGWTAESGLPQNTIKSQTIPAGQSAPFGSSIDVTVLRSANALLIYDDNDITLVNKTGGDLNLGGITFSTLDGNSASFGASRWSNNLQNDQCTQLWSLARNGAKGLDECTFIQNWLTTNNPAEHFWTGAGGTTQFALFQDGIQRATCPVSATGRCEFYVSSSASADTTPYVYFVYTTDRLAILNQSSDQFMVTAGFNVYNYNTQVPGVGLNLGDTTLYKLDVNPVASVERLAPNQCILYTNGSPTSPEAPQACDIIARKDLDPSIIFWGKAFEMDSVTDGQRHTCPAATEGKLTICAMPR